jgi:hypothetical protein
MKYILFIFVVVFNNVSAQISSEEFKVNTDYALDLLLKVDAVMYTDSNVVYGFDEHDLKANLADIIYKDNKGNVVLRIEQIQPLITASLKELVKRDLEQNSRIIQLELENENLKIQFNNEITRLAQEVNLIKREIAP